MQKRNYFVSYHHSSNYTYLQALREKLSDKTFSDYGFKEDDQSESSKRTIAKKIQYRLWSSSVTIVLVGEQTGKSDWIDWEIWYSLQRFKNAKISRRSFKPKGLLAIYLPIDHYHVPMRLQANIDSGYAVTIHWNELESLFDEKVSLAYKNRRKTQLIRNDLPLKNNPRNFLVPIASFFKRSKEN